MSFALGLIVGILLTALVLTAAFVVEDPLPRDEREDGVV